MTQLAVLDPDALDFAPDLLAIQERPPARLPRVLLVTVAVLIGLLLAWSVFAQLDIIATAEGRLVPISFTKLVQPAEAGVVTEILVKDGDAVTEGQLLLKLDARASQADTAALGQEVALKKLTLRRIEAELADQPLLPGRGEPPLLYAQVDAQFRARRQAYLDAVAQEQETRARAQADLHASQQQLSKLTQTLPSYQQSAQAYRQLVKEGFVGELAANEKGREATEREQDVKVQTANVQSGALAIAQSERKLAALRSQYRSQLENERIETLATLNRSDQEWQKSTVRAGQLEIRAPNAGIVKDLATTTRGAVVSAGALLMNIVPQGEPLQAEVQLHNEDVGFVSVGQLAKVKVAAYPFQKYGLLDGRVILVSADAADPKQQQQQPQPPGQPQLNYRAIVQIDSPVLTSAATGEKLALNPGMAVTAEVQQGRRSVIEYLLSPVKKVAQEAARER
ncbi:HlyD family type I secretion periplasmic adaptor subunit [Rhizobacter sp. OV335]|uniref:HlyD family type I secretion periplasmic adaptor subunit n=1 Tax=Rhizobacter sp. OV335 TaxID=1500264 RepID=UPI0009101DDD|nr:HlyD family type I secretion periplasmic adaptor subunit [Rhizobacter sp. OV335]SHN20169.1 HlyD family secretion protein [Rhizobacter sp. OV335]